MKIVIHSIIACLIIGPMMSCKKFVQIDPPKTQLIPTTVFESDATATSAIINLYISMINQTANPYTMSLYPALSADELKTYSTLSYVSMIYTNSLNPLDAQTVDIWKSGYNCIYQANSIIEGCKNSTRLSDAVKKQLMGEALFFRAFWHFYLVNEFGNIPIVISTDYKLNTTLPNSSSDKVYRQIIADLTEAQTYLNENYVDGSSITTSIERVRVNKSAASALLSRVYLYDEQYANAEMQATNVIANTALYRMTKLDSVFLKNSSETIWAIMRPLPSTQNTPEGVNWILTSKPTSNQGNANVISDVLLDAFEPGDQRKEKWIGKSMSDGIDYYFPYKYKVATNSSILEYSVVLRLAEMYLIRAEARAMQSNLGGAIEDIDVIRQRAGIPLIKNNNPDITKDDLIKMILHERRVELFTEWGHRWFDLKRSGTINTVMAGAAIWKGGTWDSWRQFFPIPQTERNNDPNLSQNPGYDLDVQ